MYLPDDFSVDEVPLLIAMILLLIVIVELTFLLFRAHQLSLLVPAAQDSVPRSHHRASTLMSSMVLHSCRVEPLLLSLLNTLILPSE